MLIKDLKPCLHEQGKIKIGRKQEQVRKGKSGRKYQAPVKTDYVFVTTLEKDEHNNFIEDKELTQKLTKEKNSDGNPVLIGPCIFLYNDMKSNLITSYCRRGASHVDCRGDGKTAIRYLPDGETKKIKCPGKECKYIEEGKCTPTCILSVVFPDAPRAGGVYRFRSSGWNSVEKLQSGLYYFWLWSNKKLAGIPFYLRVNRGESTTQGGRTRVFYYLSIEYENTLRSLTESPDRIEPPQGLPSPETGEQQRAIMVQKTDEDLDEFQPLYEVDEESGVVTDRDGKIVDRVKKEEQGNGPWKGKAEALEEGEEDTKKEGKTTEGNVFMQLLRETYSKYQKIWNDTPKEKRPPKRGITKEQLEGLTDKEIFRLSREIRKEIKEMVKEDETEDPVNDEPGDDRGEDSEEVPERDPEEDSEEVPEEDPGEAPKAEKPGKDIKSKRSSGGNGNHRTRSILE